MTAQPARARRSPAEQTRLENELREMFQTQVSFNRILGLQVVSCDPHQPAMSFEMTPTSAMIGHFHSGRLHGGVISAVLDTTAGLALMCAIGDRFSDEPSTQILGRFARIGSIDIRVDYLRPGLGKTFTSTAQVTRLGGRVASVQMALRNDQHLLIATEAGAYVVS